MFCINVDLRILLNMKTLHILWRSDQTRVKATTFF